MDVLVQELLKTGPQPAPWILFGLATGIAMFIAISTSVAEKTHLRNRKRLLGYFFLPHQPRRMFVFSDSEKVYVYYDNEVKIDKGENETLITANDGLSVKVKDLYKRMVNVWDARGPSGIHGPYSLGWRWLVGSSIVLYSTIMSLISSIDDGRIRGLEILQYFGQLTSIEAQQLLSQIRYEQSINIVITGLATAVAIAWFFGFMWIFKAKSIEYYEYIIFPNPGKPYDGIPAVHAGSKDALSILKNKITIEIKVPEKVKDIYDKLKKRLGNDDDALAAIINNRLVLSDELKKELGDLHIEVKQIRKAAEARVMQTYGAKLQQQRRRQLIAFTVILILASTAFFLMGMALGAAWNISVEQPNNQTSYSYEQQNQGIPVEPGSGNYTVTPAPPPPPPVATSG